MWPFSFFIARQKFADDLSFIVIGDDDVVSALKQNTALMALGDNGRWRPVNNSSTDKEEESKEKTSLTRKTETTTDG